MRYPKEPRYENRAVLDLARDKPCLIRSKLCEGGTERTVSCHGGGVANGKGMGYKVGDHLTAWGCGRCNFFTDAYSGATKDEKTRVFEAAHQRQIIAWQFIAKSPTESPKAVKAARDVLSFLYTQGLIA
jgi:hypothetical protein